MGAGGGGKPAGLIASDRSGQGGGMAAPLAGGAQLLLQLLLAGQPQGILARPRLASQLPFTVGIVNAPAQAQEPLAGPVGLGASGQQQGPLIAQQFRGQAPGPGGGRLVEGRFEQLVALLQGQGHQ